MTLRGAHTTISLRAGQSVPQTPGYMINIPLWLLIRHGA